MWLQAQLRFFSSSSSFSFCFFASCHHGPIYGPQGKQPAQKAYLFPLILEGGSNIYLTATVEFPRKKNYLKTPNPSNMLGVTGWFPPYHLWFWKKKRGSVLFFGIVDGVLLLTVTLLFLNLREAFLERCAEAAARMGEMDHGSWFIIITIIIIIITPKKASELIQQKGCTAPKPSPSPAPAAFISCSSWNFSGSPPLSGCSSKAIFLYTALMSFRWSTKKDGHWRHERNQMILGI